MRWKHDTLSGWGRALTGEAEIARPERARGLADAGAPAIGNRRSYGDAPLNTGGRVVDMTRLDRILDFDPETGLITVEAGLPIGDLVRLMAPRGWLPPVIPGTGFATVGGCIAMDVHGKNHHGAGSFGQHVTAITLVRDGTEQTITPADGDLFRATCGGLGQTGIIARARMQLKRGKADLVTVTERRAEDWDEHIALLDASDATYCVGWIDATARGPALGRGILEEAETAAGLVPKPKASKSVPINAPHWALSPPVVKLFNAAYYRRVPARGRTVVKPITDFFFPLDAIHDWNRLYGKRGFHQFQCVVPLDQTDALRGMLTRIAGSGLASPLAVLKRMGPGRAGHLSFPMEGYTLAVDFPNRPAAETLIARLEEMTIEAGGRLYFAKDALAGPGPMAAMYPEQGAWAKTVNALDPDHAFETDLTRRLQLRSPT